MLFPLPSIGTNREPTELLTNVQKPRRINQYNPVRQHLRNSQTQSNPRSFKPSPTPVSNQSQRPNRRKAAAFPSQSGSIPFKFPVNRSTYIQRNHYNKIYFRPGDQEPQVKKDTTESEVKHRCYLLRNRRVGAGGDRRATARRRGAGCCGARGGGIGENLSRRGESGEAVRA